MLWLGGPPGSGKTTVATRIARRHGLRWYGADTRTWAHRDRALDSGDPAAVRWEAMTPEERWERSTPAEMLEMSLHDVRATMVVDDVRALPASPLIVAEGSTVSPTILSSGMADRARAVWLLPAASFQRARLDERRLPPGQRRLYELLAETIAREVSEAGVPVVRVDGSAGVEDVVATVEELFADPLAAGPSAETAAERRALLREANESIVEQVRGFYARPWASGEAATVVRDFLCECGDCDCVASVELPVGSAAAGPALAPGHG